MPKPIFPSSCWAENENLGDFKTLLGVVIDDRILLPNVKNIYLQIEPNELVGNREWIINNHEKFDKIFCWDEHLLSLKNSVFFPFGTCWITKNKEYKKQFAISNLCSSKAHLPGHQIRYQVYQILSTCNICKYNKITPPRIELKDEVFDGFEYSVIIENISSNNWFTEKLIDCLVSKTIPIYYGCPNIYKYFDDSYFFKFHTIDQFKDIVKNLNSNYYKQNLDKICYNKEEALKYQNLWPRFTFELRKYYA